MSVIRPIETRPTVAAPPSRSAHARSQDTSERLRRVVCHHQWTTLTEWAGALNDLADLNDESIEDLARS